MKPVSHMIYTVPMQIKEDISLGNLYDFIIADFFGKTQSAQWKRVINPLTLNINGNKTQQLLEKNNIPLTASDKIDTYIEKCKYNILVSLAEYWVNFSSVVRDDQIENQLTQILEWVHTEDTQIDEIYINNCPSCWASFGTDFTISTCTKCNATTKRHLSHVLFQEINHNLILEKIDSIDWKPAYSKSKLLNFVNSLPNTYKLTLSKNRDYTLHYKWLLLDPRFITIVSKYLEDLYNIDETTIIHGDILKKYDYYMLCHTNKEALPTQIISHGLITDNEDKKIRWTPTSNSNNTQDIYSPKAIRCILLKNDIYKGVKFDEKNLKKQVKQVTKYYIKIKQMLNNTTTDTIPNYTKLNNFIRNERDNFLQSANNFKFWPCFNQFTKIIDHLWKNTKDNWLDLFQSSILKNLLLFYFWENVIWAQNENQG